MVVFSTYVTPMDREYGKSTVGDNSTNDVGIGVQDIGMSIPMGIAAANVQGIGSKIKSGAGAVEIQFPGAVRGTRQAHTPGMYGVDQREALRELAKINEIKLTTHASMGIMGLAGIDQQGNFSKEQRKLAVDEIKRAVEFAADTAKGGSVVVHTGEFQRPISEEPWAQDPTAPGGYRFKHYGEEPERAIIRVIDDRTGQVMTQVRKNQKVARPVWNKYEDDNKKYWEAHKGASYVDANNNTVNPGDYVDYEGNKTDIKNRVPVYDPTSGRFKVEVQGWDHFVKEAEERNKDMAKEKGITLQQLKEQYPGEYMLPEEAFLRATLETNEGHSRGWALQYAHDFDTELEMLEKLRKSRKFFEKIEAAVPEEERWKITKRFDTKLTELGLVPIEYKMPTEIIDDQIKSFTRRVEFSRQASTSQQQQAADSAETQQHVMSARKYALKESYKSYAEAGIHAMDVTKTQHLEAKPLMVTMENIFPESYGAHPDELKSLIQNSRKQMADMLVEQRGLSKEGAEKTAETHIKATLDTGHFNMWRKYWQNDPKKTLKENDRGFQNWLLKKTEELAKAKIIGNVHLTDNFGYQDDHLAPGMGTTPVKEIAKILRKHGYKGALTVEPGADASTDLGDFWGLMKTWRLFGSPIYGAHGPVRADVPKRSWSDIQYSYFGQTKAPYYIFGPYSPSQDWTLWTQVPME